MLTNDGHPVDRPVAASIFGREGVPVEARCICHALRLMKEVFPFIIWEAATLPVSSSVLSSMVKETDVVVRLFERPNLGIDEVI